jgi:hypothetical protein
MTNQLSNRLRHLPEWQRRPLLPAKIQGQCPGWTGADGDAIFGTTGSLNRRGWTVSWPEKRMGVSNRGA